jgi:hypothetical protein
LIIDSKWAFAASSFERKSFLFFFSILTWKIHFSSDLYKRFTFNVMTVILNKYIFQKLHWVYPISLTVIHMATCTGNICWVKISSLINSSCNSYKIFSLNTACFFLVGSIFILKVLKLKMFPFTYLDWNKYLWGAVPLAYAKQDFNFCSMIKIIFKWSFVDLIEL